MNENEYILILYYIVLHRHYTLNVLLYSLVMRFGLMLIWEM